MGKTSNGIICLMRSHSTLRKAIVVTFVRPIFMHTAVTKKHAQYVKHVIIKSEAKSFWVAAKEEKTCHKMYGLISFRRVLTLLDNAI